MADNRTYISQIQLPNDATTYYLKDSVARDLIAQLQGVTFHKCTSASDTPLGVSWDDGGTTITGTLTAANAIKSYIYLVPAATTSTGDAYAEYIPVNLGTEQSPTWSWERLGDTDIDLDSLGNLAYHDNVVLNKGASATNVLGASTTFTNAASAVTFTGGSTDTFVKSYPGATSKLVTGSAAKAASAATSVSYVGDANTSSILASASVSSEVLSFGTASVSQGSVTGTDGTVTVATGALDANGGGASVMTGLGTASTASAVTGVGTAEAAAQAITVGTNDRIGVAKYSDLSVSITDNP